MPNSFSTDLFFFVSRINFFAVKIYEMYVYLGYIHITWEFKNFIFSSKMVTFKADFKRN